MINKTQYLDLVTKAKDYISQLSEDRSPDYNAGQIRSLNMVFFWLSEYFKEEEQ